MTSSAQLRKEIADLARSFYHRGWSLATSSNYSARISENEILITASGLDKAALDDTHSILIDLNGKIIHPDKETLKPSAEALLHCALYRKSPTIGAVLHTHSVYSTILSMQSAGELVLEGYEMLKALRGVTTHLHKETLPIFPNDQDMEALSATVVKHRGCNSDAHGFLLNGHGLYTWGLNLADAKRHTEALEFLLECEYRRRGLKGR